MNSKPADSYSLYSLTKREREYLLWALRGKTAKETAKLLGASPNTASKMLRAAVVKMDAPNKFVAAMKASRLGMLEIVSIDSQADAARASASGHPGVLPVDPTTWPAVLIPLESVESLQFEHVETQIFDSDSLSNTASPPPLVGYSFWSVDTPSGYIGLCWFWTVISFGVTALWDPMSIHSNLVATSSGLGSSNRHVLASLVSRLPWQIEANRCMDNTAFSAGNAPKRIRKCPQEDRPGRASGPLWFLCACDI
ncbi:helix-turn-helix transcriptional regulator [Paucibacter soli]|uniref:helix-turn-helix transcriptional regulator n=1 Tax=Paucibacter soli TaxID=3133433 RepID=UPI0030A155BD